MNERETFEMRNSKKHDELRLTLHLKMESSEKSNWKEKYLLI